MYVIKLSTGEYISSKYGQTNSDLQKARVFKSKGGATNVVNNVLVSGGPFTVIAVELKEK